MPSRKITKKHKKSEAQLRKEFWSESAKMAHEEQMVAVDAAYDENPSAEKTHLNQIPTKELQSEWAHLRRIAKAKYPEGQNELGLSPNNRLVAIAACLGWNASKISKASGIAKSTVGNWLRARPDIQVFMDEFSMKRGTTGADSLINENAIRGLQIIKEIQNDRDQTIAMKRLKKETAVIAIERKWGKAVQPIEDRGDAIRQLYEVMGKLEPTILSIKEEKETFGEPDKKIIN